MAVVAATFDRMTIDQLVCTMRTNTLNHVADMMHLKPFGNGDIRNFNILQADSFATDAARQMHMPMPMQAIFLLSAAIIDHVQKVFFDHERQRAEQCATIDRRQDAFQIGDGKGIVERKHGSPHQNADCRRAHAVFGEEIGNIHFQRILRVIKRCLTANLSTQLQLEELRLKVDARVMRRFATNSLDETLSYKPAGTTA